MTTKAGPGRLKALLLALLRRPLPVPPRAPRKFLWRDVIRHGGGSR